MMANTTATIRRREVLAAASMLQAQLVRQPAMVSRQYAKFLGELGRVAAGRSTLAPAKVDRRLRASAWTDGGGFRRLLQAYIALGQSLDACVDGAKLDPVAAGR